jgi:hypothetical protein
MNHSEPTPGNAYLFEIATFLLMCAHESLDPSSKYHSLRMLDVISKLADFPQHVSELNEDPFLLHIKQEIEDAEGLLMNDPEGFREFMNRLVDQFVDEMKKRS